MKTLKNTHWEQWDAQANARFIAYIELNNLYLAVERGQIALTITTANKLRCLAPAAYHPRDPMINWWEREFQRLPNWNNV